MRALAICALLVLGGCQKTDVPDMPNQIPAAGPRRLLTTPEGCVLYGAYNGNYWSPYAFVVICPAGFTGGVS